MAYTPSSSHCEAESLSMNRPPSFKGIDYGFWKNRMKIFLRSNDLNLWRVIENRPYKPTKVEGGKVVEKDESEWTSEDDKKVSINEKAINLLHIVLICSEYDHISTCISAQQIWKMLELRHEGTSQVKDSKINMLVTKYELFKMNTNESISDMYARLTCICNELASLGKPYSDGDKVQKILRSLPKALNTKVTAIKEAKDLRTLKIEELLGSLMTHELEMMNEV